MAEEIKSFLISFGTYLFFTFAWWALKAGFDAGELLDCMFSFIPLFEVRSDEGLTYIIFFFQCTGDCATGSLTPSKRTVMPSNGHVSWAALNCRRRYRHHCLFFLHLSFMSDLHRT